MTDYPIESFEPKNFEAVSTENGTRSWRASEFMLFLGYATWSSFSKSINRAMATCATLDIPVHDNFEAVSSPGMPIDYKLTRFACYLIAMNGDVRKPQVAQAQAYFATIAESFRRHLEEAENVERVALRSEATDREKSLAREAKRASVERYAYFQNAGYRGMYNMNLRELKAFKGVDERAILLDYMGKAELAGNLFRITQTEEKIRNDQIRGQAALEDTAFKVGRKVRDTMMEISGTAPEHLPIAEDIKSVRKRIRNTHKRFRKMDDLPTSPVNVGENQP